MIVFFYEIIQETIILISISSLFLIFTSFAFASAIPDYNFAIAGDQGYTKNTKKTVDFSLNQNPAIVFSLGDMSYGKDINCRAEIIKPISDKIKANW